LHGALPLCDRDGRYIVPESAGRRRHAVGRDRAASYPGSIMTRSASVAILIHLATLGYAADSLAEDAGPRAADAPPLQRPTASSAERPTEEPGEPAAALPTRLDLRVPPITRLYTPEQIETLLAGTRDIEEVEVEGRREPPAPPTPAVWGGIAAPAWAILNPSQAWRILAPIPPDRSEALNRQPDATDTHREPIRPPQLEP